MKIIKTNLTLPNILTLLRLPLGFILVFAVKYYSPPYIIALLGLITLTDILDGYCARKLNLVSEVGKALDPVVDKCVQIFICIALIEIYPNLFALSIIYILIQMFTITLGTILIIENVYTVQSDWIGKITTCIFYVILSILLLKMVSQINALYIFGLIVLITILSGIYYLKRGDKNAE